MKKLIEIVFLTLALCFCIAAHAQEVAPTTAGALPENLLNTPVSQWQLNGLTILVIVQLLGRAYSALRGGGGLKGIWTGIIYGTNVPKVLFFLGVLSLFTACGPARLEPGGIYAPGIVATNGVVTPTQQPDPAFYYTDASFALAYSAVDAAFEFERNNRVMLFKVSPDIKHTLDKIRKEAVLARDKYLAARRIYLANPVPPNLTQLESALEKIQQLSTTATAVLPKS